MRCSVLIILGVTTLACAPHAGNPQPARQLGDYAFRIDVESSRISGNFSVRADSIVVDDEGCRPDKVVNPLSRRSQGFRPSPAHCLRGRKLET